MSKFDNEKRFLPDFPRTEHLPIEPNTSVNDFVCSEKDLEYLLSSKNVTIEEKVDGANCGMTIYSNHPLIRNRKHILNKAYTNTKTPSKIQFVSVWNWWYANSQKFKKLSEILGFTPAVYGEWMLAKHTIYYDKLPSLFITYDIFNPIKQCFLDPNISRKMLEEAGFAVVPLIGYNVELTSEKLKNFRDGLSFYSSSENREGIYIKISDGEKITHRYKMVKNGFSPDDDWNKKDLIKNKII